VKKRNEVNTTKQKPLMAFATSGLAKFKSKAMPPYAFRPET